MSSKITRLASRWLGLAVGAAMLLAAPLVYAADPPSSEGWEEISRTGSLVIYSRNRPGTSIKETRAIGTMDAPNWVIKNVLDDIEHYPSFMPYIVESKVLYRNVAKHAVTVYTRMTPPLIDPRDYTLLIHDDPAPRRRWHDHLRQPLERRQPARSGRAVRHGARERQRGLLGARIHRQRRAHARDVHAFHRRGRGHPGVHLQPTQQTALERVVRGAAKQAKDPKYRQTKPAGP